MKVILGLLQPSTGQVKIGGRPLTRAALAHYRGIVGTVMQDDLLFTGSVSENISFFDPEPDQGQIERCARIAGVHQEVEQMPLGYASLLSEAGTGLSGGQRQRVLLARACTGRRASWCWTRRPAIWTSSMSTASITPSRRCR